MGSSTSCCHSFNSAYNNDIIQQKPQNKKNKVTKETFLKDHFIDLQKYQNMGDIQAPGKGSVLCFNYLAEIGFLSPSQFRVKKIFSQVEKDKGDGNWKNAFFVGNESLLLLHKLIKNLQIGNENDWGFVHIILTTNKNQISCTVNKCGQQRQMQELQKLNYKKTVIKFTEEEIFMDGSLKKSKISQNYSVFDVIENVPYRMETCIKKEVLKLKRLAVVISVQTSEVFYQHKDQISKYIYEFKQRNLDDDDLMSIVAFNQKGVSIIKS